MSNYQPIKLPQASAPELGKLVIEDFRGLDLTNAPGNVAPVRSPWAPNMLRESVGKVRKWTGWMTVRRYGGRINGVHFLRGPEGVKRLVHAGTELWLDGEEPLLLCGGMADAPSASQQMGGKLLLLDGATYRIYDGEEAKPASEGAHIPTTVIGRAPTGGGKSYEPVNLLQPKRTNSFLGTAADKTYQLDFAPLDAGPVTARKRQSDGEWINLVEGTDFTVDRTAGKVTFTVVPGASPVEGEDNVTVTAAKTVDGYADKVNKCTFCELYGVNGAEDRVFMSGNPALPNYDFFSEFEKPDYMPDINYGLLGQDDAAVKCYAKINNGLAAIKDNAASETNIIIRTGRLGEDGKAGFYQSGSYQAAGAVSGRTLCYAANEPLYLTEGGIYAMTPTDVTGERSAALRSYYLNGGRSGERGILNEQGKGDACACAWNGFYILALAGKLYALDTTQAAADRNAPYSQRQFEGFIRLNVPARTVWAEGAQLWFGTADGRVCRFYTPGDERTLYTDDGEPYDCYWLTPEFSGKTFYNRKRFSYVGARIASAPMTGLRICAKYDGCEREVDGEYEVLMDYGAEARYFAYSALCYGKFSYSTSRSPKTLGSKIKIKNVDKCQFRLENSKNEPLGLYMATVEYAESGKFVK